MKYIFPLLALCFLISCDTPEEIIETTNIRINHYKQVAVGESVTLVYLMQDNEKIGTNQWNLFYSDIEGFDFEWGFVYDLIIEKQHIKNPPADASSIRYILKKIVSKKPLEPNLTFNIQLKSSARDINNVVKSSNLEYTLLGEKIIDCGNKCLEMSELLGSKNEVIGIFQHGNDKIKLQALTD